MPSFCLSGNIGSERWWLSENIRCDSCVLCSTLLLHSPPSKVPSDPRCHVLVDFDHDEENDAIDHNHAEDHTQVYPLWSVDINLEYFLQDVFARYLRKVRCLVVEYQAAQIVLVLTLKEFSIVCFWIIKVRCTCLAFKNWGVLVLCVRITCSAQKWKLMYDIG